MKPLESSAETQSGAKNPKKIRRLAIANRGEVAVRILRACEDLGIEGVLLHSEADVRSKAFRMANKAICIGGSPSSESYLNAERIIWGALATQADAIHPGFGFLSENADFADRVKEAGLIFVGPPGEAMRLLGDKVACKERARKLGLPLIPGYAERGASVEKLVREAEKLGFPVVVKAAAGGGGRGMKVLRSRDGAEALVESAQREAQSAFGDASVFLEKYFERARHLEVQIFVDSLGTVKHFFERDCSVQRRHQKIIEEAPGFALPPELRRKMQEAAIRLVQGTRYQGAATVEFLVQDGEFYLLEVNTRLQVEHPVTEEICGFDLVKAQIQTAQGESVFINLSDSEPRQHSLECRIYAEDPFQGGIPSTGPLGHMVWPMGPGRRFELGFEEGDEVSSFYDSMIAKVIVRDESRVRAIQKMQSTLAQCVIFGVKTNIPLLQEILSHPDFINEAHNTRFFEKHFSQALKPLEPSSELVSWARSVCVSSAKSSGAQSDFTEDLFLKGWRI